jgi:hypothetical protein
MNIKLHIKKKMLTPPNLQQDFSNPDPAQANSVLVTSRDKIATGDFIFPLPALRSNKRVRY